MNPAIYVIIATVLILVLSWFVGTLMGAHDARRRGFRGTRAQWAEAGYPVGAYQGKRFYSPRRLRAKLEKAARERQIRKPVIPDDPLANMLLREAERRGHAYIDTPDELEQMASETARKANA